MRHYVIPAISFLLLNTMSVFCQSLNMEDGFEDGDFTSNPEWTGDTSNFTIENINDNHLLRLGAAGSGTSYLSTPVNQTVGSWEFFIRLDFAPSGSNRAFIYLMSDKADLKNSPSGYAIRAGEGGSDDVFHLVRIVNGSEQYTVISGTTDISSGGEFRVRVTREEGGFWTLEVGDGYFGPTEPEGSGWENSQMDATHSGILLDYTSTRTDKFYFDFRIDLPPFTAGNVLITGNEVDVIFNRSYEETTVQAADFFMNNGPGHPNSITYADDKTIRLEYDAIIASGKYSLEIDDIEDKNGTPVAPDYTIECYVFGDFTKGDIIINEFVYDPPSDLDEYVELKNVSAKYFNLKDWKIGDNTTFSTIAQDTTVLEPGAFVVLSRDTSALFHRFGDRNYLAVSVPFLNNDEDAVHLRDNRGITVDSLYYAIEWGGRDVSLERISPAVTSVYPGNWGDSSHPLGGTPGKENTVDPDNTAPKITGLTAASSLTINIAFDEYILPDEAEQPTNYTVSENTVSSVSRTAEDSVTITLGSELKNGSVYHLSVTDISDIFGNSVTRIDTAFTFLQVTEADSGDIFINEFIPVPPSGQAEYIELYNASNKTINLQNWSLNDNRGIRTTITTEKTLLPPGGFIVLTPDLSIASTYPDIPLLTLGSRFPALNNSGDDIVIRKADGTLIDSLRYTSYWGEDESALERRTTDVAAYYPENWGSNPGTGTPGAPNNILPDTEAPAIRNISILDPYEIQFLFSERIAPVTALNRNNYKISPDPVIKLISLQDDTVTLSLENDLVSGTEYEIVLNDIEDLFGNKIKTHIQSIDYLKIEAATAGDLVINEILYKKSGDGGPEFIEVFNISHKNISLNGWKVGDATGTAKITDNIQLKAGEILVFTDNQKFTEASPEIHHLANFPSLNDTGDIVYLQNRKGNTIDSLHYSSRWGGSVAGVSLERIDPRAASNDPSNWRTNSVTAGNTAGEVNSVFLVDSIPPEVIYSRELENGNLVVRFNEFITLREDTEFIWRTEHLDIAEFDSTEGNIIYLSPSKSKTTRKGSRLIVNNLVDVRGNSTTSFQLPVSYRAEPGDLVINEIMFRPLSDSRDNIPDQAEYVELRNIRNHAVSLEGTYLHDAPDEEERIRKLIPFTTTAKWVPSQGTVLIYADEVQDFLSTRIAKYFNLKQNDVDSHLHVQRSTLSLGSADAVYIASETGTVIDSVYYDESWHNPNLIDTRGIALEKINPAGPGNDPSNWGSSVDEKGGTPGSENSVYQVPAESNEAIGISFSPNPFSPDDDGYEDNLFINYRLDATDYLMTITIFDRYGRKVRSLEDGKPAGPEGTVVWDGRRDDGSRNRIGIYIVVFEAYDSSTGNRRAFKETVVLARRLN